MKAIWLFSMQQNMVMDLTHDQLSMPELIFRIILMDDLRFYTKADPYPTESSIKRSVLIRVMLLRTSNWVQRLS